MFDREFIFPSSLGNSMSDHPGYDPPYITYFFKLLPLMGITKILKILKISSSNSFWFQWYDIYKI